MAERLDEPVTPDYWAEACEHLMERDRIMRRLIPQYQSLQLVSRNNPFVTLARAVVGQQISVKAADAVWGRLMERFPRFSPGTVMRNGPESLADCGLSKRKVEYITDLARQFKGGRIHVSRWAEMSDTEVIGELTGIRGIGVWTAQMFLIFNLLRPNVFPVDDLGLMKAISLHYFSGEPVNRVDAREVAENWEPWCTVATWYLWRSLDPLPVEY